MRYVACLLIVCALLSVPRKNRADPQQICGPDEKHNISCHCTNDAKADEAYYKVGRPVAKITFQQVAGGDWYDGTGFLIGDQNTLLTNRHAILTDHACSTMVAYFNYELDEQNNPRASNQFTASHIIGYSPEADLDYCLVQLNGDPQFAFGSLPVDARFLFAGEALRIPQHPGGDYKRISIENCEVTNEFNATPPHFEDECDTEEGSSGSPVLDADLEVVGLHRGAINYACPNVASRMVDIVDDLSGTFGFHLGPAQPISGCPPPAPTGSGCSCNKSEPEPCVIYARGVIADPSVSFSPDYAVLETAADISQRGLHTFTLDQVTEAARRGTVTWGTSSGLVGVGDVQVGAMFQVRRLLHIRDGLSGAPTPNEVCLQVMNVSGSVDSLTLLPGYPWPLGSPTGHNTFSLDAGQLSLIRIAGTSGIASLSGDVALLLRNNFFGLSNLARIHLRVGGYFDFGNRTAHLTSVSWDSQSTAGQAPGIPTLTEIGIGLLALTLVLLGLALMRQRSSHLA
jgi:V8-like Glu-specific endopeptidase